jgi:hypothetical protein
VAYQQLRLKHGRENSPQRRHRARWARARRELTGLSMGVTMSSRLHVFHNRLADSASLDLERDTYATVRRHSILRCLGHDPGSTQAPPARPIGLLADLVLTLLSAYEKASRCRLLTTPSKTTVVARPRGHLPSSIKRYDQGRVVPQLPIRTQSRDQAVRPALCLRWAWPGIRVYMRG